MCTDAKGEWHQGRGSIIALIDFGEGEYVHRMDDDGVCFYEDDLSIINAPAPRREFWVNVYADGDSFALDSRESADADANVNATLRIACVHVTEGDGM